MDIMVIKKLFFSSDAEGKLNIYPKTKKEKHFVKTIISVLKKHMKKNDKILEVASGNGWASIPFLKAGYEVITSDLAVWRIKQLKENTKKLKKKPKIVRCNAEKLPFKNNTFDIVYCISSLHHFNKPEKAIKEFNRVLKPKGKLILLEKNYLNPITWFGDFLFNKIYRTWKEKTLTKNQIYNLLFSAGFKKMDAKYVRMSKLFLSDPILYITKKEQ